MPPRVVYLNGQFVPELDARVHFFDAGVLWGDMAFEATRTFGGQAFQLESHLDRLFGSLDRLAIDPPLTRAELIRITEETLKVNQQTESPAMEWQILHNISPGPAGDYVSAFPPQQQRATVCIQCFPLLPRLAKFAPFYRDGVNLVIPQQRALPATIVDPHAKTRSRAHSRMAERQAKAIHPDAWPLLLTEDGLLAEGTSWNVFLVDDGVLKTPSLEHVLPGVSRAITLQCAREIGLPVWEGDLPQDSLETASEVFCTATSFCLVHARQVNGRLLQPSGPGPVVRKLTAEWQRVVGVDFVTQSRQFAEQLPAWLRKEANAHLQPANRSTL